MNVRSECFLQTIDKNRINNYEAEFAQYEKDLAAYKKEHGIVIRYKYDNKEVRGCECFHFLFQ